MTNYRIPPDHRRLLAIAESAVAVGERIALKHFKQDEPLNFSFKAHREIVTKGDLESNRAIIAILKKRTPTIPVCSEEGGDITKEQLLKTDLAWVLDPIDGTSNYAARLPLWGISLALVENGESIVGVVALPAVNKRLTAIRNGGAWNGKRRIMASKTRLLEDAVGFMCYGYRAAERKRGISIANAFIPRVRVARRLGAAVFEATHVARGLADFSILNGVKPWDIAAGALIVREAGGKALGLDGKDWTIGNPDIVFVGPKLADQVIGALRRAKVK